MPQPLCSSTTAAGKPCRNRAMLGSELCSVHLGLAGGRPTLLDDVVVDQLVTVLRAGNYVHIACRAAGIAYRTFKDWMARGESEAPEDTVYRELRDRVEQARAEGQIRHVALVSQAAAEDWRAATWLLERQYPQLWGGVSVRIRAEPDLPETEPAFDDDDPFLEVDELAEARRRRDAS